MTDKKTTVYVRLIFRRIGTIDTLNQKYQAHVSIESRWVADILEQLPKFSKADQTRLSDGKSVSLPGYDEKYWHPQLFIENSIGDLKQKLRYSTKQSRDDQLIYVCEHRDVTGFFWEQFNLSYFPCDTQNLSVSIGSMLFDDEVELVADPNHYSGVNRDLFIDQQEWSLYSSVDIERKFNREFLFENSNEEDADDTDDEKEKLDALPSGDRCQPILTVTCHAARKGNYFYWNGYYLIFSIMIVSFCIFTIPAHLVANRIGTNATLLLASIALRWTMNRSLPIVSYLTLLDKYAIVSMIGLMVHGIWHGIIGLFVFLYVPEFRLTPTMAFTKLDYLVFIITFGQFVLFHVFFLVWLFAVPLKHRRQLSAIDAKNNSSRSGDKFRSKKRKSKVMSKKKETFESIPLES